MTNRILGITKNHNTGLFVIVTKLSMRDTYSGAHIGEKLMITDRRIDLLMHTVNAWTGMKKDKMNLIVPFEMLS